MEMNIGWAFAFALVIGIPIAGIISGIVASWLKYRYRRAALETLKAYAANGRDPPEGLIAALAPHYPPGWGFNSKGSPMHGPFDDEISPEDEDDLAEFRRGKDRFIARARRRHYRRSPIRAWRQAIFWGAMTTGFWLAADYIATGDAHDSLTIVAIIMGALTVASTLGAILTTVAHANDRTKAD